jgi:hypothetical protein
MLQDGATPWVVTEQGKLRKAMGLLRSRMLRWWKRRVLTSFMKWVRAEYPKLEDTDKKWAGCVGWQDGKYHWRADGDCRLPLWAAVDLIPGETGSLKRRGVAGGSGKMVPDRSIGDGPGGTSQPFEIGCGFISGKILPVTGSCRGMQLTEPRGRGCVQNWLP